MTSPTQYHNVFKVKYTLGMADPEETETRYHTVVFVEIKADGSGFVHHVTGVIVAGMSYQNKGGKFPNSSQTFYAKEFIGLVTKSQYPANFDTVCRAQPPPGRQKAFNSRTMRYGAIKANGSFYAPGEPRPRYFKCTEWTETRAIPSLINGGVLLQGHNQQPCPGSNGSVVTGSG